MLPEKNFQTEIWFLVVLQPRDEDLVLRIFLETILATPEAKFGG